MAETADLIEVYAPQTPAEVLLLQQLLAEERIEAYVVNDGMEGVTGEIPAAYARPRIWVKTTAAARARQVCEAFDARLRDRAHGAPVNDIPFCYHCGETLRESAERCPSCGCVLN